MTDTTSNTAAAITGIVDALARIKAEREESARAEKTLKGELIEITQAEATFNGTGTARATVFSSERETCDWKALLASLVEEGFISEQKRCGLVRRFTSTKSSLSIRVSGTPLSGQEAAP